MTPLVQLALDVTDTDEAIRLGRLGLQAGADWLEVGKPLLEFEGIKGIGRLIEEFPGVPIVLDLMIMAGPERYLRAASGAGVSSVTVTALAPSVTVHHALECGRRYGVDVTVDLFNVADVLATARQYASEGASLMVHFGVDQKRNRPDGSPISVLAEVAAETDARISYATYDAAEAQAAVAAGADVIVQGEPLLTGDGFPGTFAEFVRSTKSQEREVRR